LARRARAVSLALVIATTSLIGSAAHAGTASDLVSMANAERTSRGLRAVAIRGDLAAVAQAHAERMAKAGRVYHNPDLENQVSGWRALGENVGKGESARQLHRLFMESPEHRAIILNARYNQVGVGASARNGWIYVSEVFADRGTVTAPEPAPAPRVATRASRSAPRAARVVVKPPVRALPLTVGMLVRMMRVDRDAVLEH
jgi:hypothetical protein